MARLDRWEFLTLPQSPVRKINARFLSVALPGSTAGSTWPLSDRCLRMEGRQQTPVPAPSPGTEVMSTQLGCENTHHLLV